MPALPQSFWQTRPEKSSWAGVPPFQMAQGSSYPSPASHQALQMYRVWCCLRKKVKPHWTPKVCISTEYSYSLMVTLRIHRGERPFICDLCGRGFPIQSSLLTHKKQSHPEGSKPWDCEYCEHRFVSKSQLEIHTRVSCIPEVFRTVVMLELEHCTGIKKKQGVGVGSRHFLTKFKFKLHSCSDDYHNAGIIFLAYT